MAMRLSEREKFAAPICRNVYRTMSGSEGATIIAAPSSLPFGMLTAGTYTVACNAFASAVGCVVLYTWEAPAYRQDFVDSLLAADAAEPEARFDNVVDMLDWLNRE